ncbi:MAG TPA: hypothetical protein VF541_20320 [Longimicrobium sp.]|jgi:RNase P/RNase MRP subunit p29
MKPILLVACACLSTVFPRTVPAQRLAVPDSGRVRITAAGWRPRHVTGTVLRSTSDTLMLRTADSLVAVPRERVTRVEVPDGTRRNVVPGLLIGVVVGATSGALLGVAGCGPGSDCQDDLALLTTAGGAGFGALIGSGVGALIRSERWRDAASARPAVSIVPAPGGRRVSLTARLAVH